MSAQREAKCNLTGQLPTPSEGAEYGGGNLHETTGWSRSHG